MHKFLRAIGFSKLKTQKELQMLIKETIVLANGREYAKTPQSSIYTEYKREVGKNIGVIVRGEFDQENTFLYSHYLPYLSGNYISSQESISIERHMEKESYAGICDEIKVGVSLIFYLQNVVPYLKLKYGKKLPISGTSLVLSALSVEGMVMMPLEKNEQGKKTIDRANKNRIDLINEARKGSEEAIEILTLEDMEIYSALSEKIKETDVFSLVDTYFMPYGVECDHYSILGEIIEFELVTNEITKEQVYQITVNCNDIILDVCIHTLDLMGEPAVGRRFKGTIWLQGEIQYPATEEKDQQDVN